VGKHKPELLAGQAAEQGILWNFDMAAFDAGLERRRGLDKRIRDFNHGS
jgi:hypothetical protein